MMSFRELEAQLAVKLDMENRLFFLIERNKTEDVKKLIREVESKVDVNAQDKDGTTPLIKAIKNKNNEIAKLLLEAKADPKIKDNNGNLASKYMECINYSNYRYFQNTEEALLVRALLSNKTSDVIRREEEILKRSYEKEDEHIAKSMSDRRSGYRRARERGGCCIA